MEHYTLDEAAIELGQKADYLQKIILFDGKPHPILKPCVFFPEPISVRILNPGVNSTYRRERLESAPSVRVNIEHTMKKVEIDTLDSFVPHSFEYPAARMQGLFELTIYPEHLDMTEAKESGRFRLYREKAVFSHLTNAAVKYIMNYRYAAMSWKEKARMREDVGDMVILTKEDLHCLVDSPKSISLAEIRITDRMLTEYAAMEGITLARNRTEMTPTKDREKKQNTGEFSQQEVLPIRFIEFYTGGKLGPETTSLLFAHKQGIDWNRRMEAADKLTAYHWQHGKITPLKRTEWESILHSIKSLSERYDKADKHFDEWRTAALKILPVAFVWRSEFDAAYRRAMSPERITFLDQYKGFERLSGDEDKEARETNDTPYIPPELMSIVFEGFEHGVMTISQGAPEPKQVSKRHIITDEERKAKSRSTIRFAVEAYLDTASDGNKAGFYTFLKQQIKLPKEVALKDGESYAFFFKDIKEKGSQEGVYLNHPKEGKKEGDPGWNHYSGNDISGIISKEKNNRKNLQPEK